MNSGRKFLVVSLISIFLFNGCEQKKQPANEKATGNNLLLATFYNNFAAEYDALAYQAYNIASERLNKIRKLNPDKDNLAVVVDIDETVLNNSPFEAELILSNQNYNYDLWLNWVNKASATAIPGALEFLKFADSLHFNIFYVSNRKKNTEQEVTIKNLRKLGFPQLEENHFLLKENESSKESRRKLISENYIIVLLAGDNLKDFYEDSADYETRDSLMLKNRSLFGKKFIVLPNAMYGAWLKSLKIKGNHKTVDSLLQIMVGD